MSDSPTFAFKACEEIWPPANALLVRWTRPQYLCLALTVIGAQLFSHTNNYLQAIPPQ